ncbi:MAG: 2-keto-3-deoxygluconate permease [Advenella sp.]
MENYTSFDRVLLKVLKIPGALMIVPLFLGVIFNTFAPEVLNIGSFTTALFKNGLAVLIGLFESVNNSV